MTAVSGSVFTAAQFNTNLRDNLLQTAPALATAAGQIFVSTAANAIAARAPATANIVTGETTTSTVYTNIATFGPAAALVQTGTQAIVHLTCGMSNSVTNVTSVAGFSLSGATTIADSDDRAIQNSAPVIAIIGGTFLQTGLTPGANSFTMHYKVTSASTGTFSQRRITVVPL